MGVGGGKIIFKRVVNDGEKDKKNEKGVKTTSG